jgi:hypothetical protein
MLWPVIAIDVIAGVVLVLAWYFGFLRYNRRKALQILNWIERAFHGHGQVAGVRWESTCRFRVQLRLSSSIFRQASLAIQLLPRELPFSWLSSRLRRQHETLTFQADLDCPPSFNLEVHNHR